MPTDGEQADGVTANVIAGALSSEHCKGGCEQRTGNNATSKQTLAARGATTGTVAEAHDGGN